METLHLKSAALQSRRLNRENLLRQPAAQKGISLDLAGLSATDLTFVSQSAKASAVKKGKGVMIGDYFVGVATGSDLLFSNPMIVY